MREVSLRRIGAFLIDWLVLALWGGLLFGTVMLLTGGEPERASNPWTAQLIAFSFMTIPFALYFAFSESSAKRATLGKRLLALRVSDRDGNQLSFGRALFRNAVKFLPWEIGHLVAEQSIYSAGASMPVWLWFPLTVSIAGPVWWVAALLLSDQTPYDRWSRSKVDSAAH